MSLLFENNSIMKNSQKLRGDWILSYPHPYDFRTALLHYCSSLPILTNWISYPIFHLPKILSNRELALMQIFNEKVRPNHFWIQHMDVEYSFLLILPQDVFKLNHAGRAESQLKPVEPLSVQRYIGNQ